jgi:hypothetical protein
MLELAKELELENIEWIKEVKHTAVFEMMAKADFFIHTSIQEATKCDNGGFNDGAPGDLSRCFWDEYCHQ